jgi:hypothetical protein
MLNITNFASNCQQVFSSNSSLPQNLNENVLNKEKGSLEEWGHERGIDPELLALNARDWNPVSHGNVPHCQTLDELTPIVAFMGEVMPSHGKQYATGKFRDLLSKYGCGGFSIEGISPITGEDSDYPRFRPLSQWQYVDDKGKVKTAKYLSRKGSQAQDFYARVPLHVALKIAERYGLSYDRPEGEYSGFWEWARENALPIFITEGEGDAMAVLSRGYIAIGIPGHHMAFKPKSQDFRAEFMWLLENKPTVTIALDRDGKQSTAQKVEQSRRKIGFALKRLGIDVKVAVWNPSQGKGFGDLSPEHLEQAVNNIVPFAIDESVQVRRDILNPFGSRQHDRVMSVTNYAQYLLENPTTDILIDAPTGAGKTNGVIPLARTASVLPIAPSRSLAASLHERLGQPATVINSLYKTPESRIAENFIIDEVDQVLSALSIGKHLKNKDANTSTFRQIARQARVIAPSATATGDELQLLEEVTGRSFELIKLTPDHGFTKGAIEVHHGDPDIAYSATASQCAVINQIREDLKHGAVLCPVDTVTDAIDLSERAKTWGLTDRQILVCTADTREYDPRVSSFLSSPNPGQWLKNHPEIRLVAYTSIIPSGFSIVDPEGVQLFKSVRGIFTGSTVSPALVNQMIYRYRSNVPISIAIPFKSHYKATTGTFHNLATGRGKQRAIQAKRMNRIDRERIISATTGRHLNFSDDEFSAYSDRLEIRLEREYRNFATATIAYLERDGFTVKVHHHKDKGELENFKAEVQRIKAEPMSRARAISESEYLSLMHTPEIPPLAKAQINAYELRKFYGLTPEDELTIEMIVAEGFGRGRRELENLLRQTIEGKALADDIARAESLGDTCYSIDMTNHQATLEIWDKLRIPEVLGYALQNPYSSQDKFLREWWDSAIVPHRQHSQQQPRLFGFRLPCIQGKDVEKLIEKNPELSRKDAIREAEYRQMVWLLGMLLNKLGFRTESERTRGGNDRLRVYRVTRESIDGMRAQILRTLETEGLEMRATPLIKVLLEGVAHHSPIPDTEELFRQYLEALEQENIERATQLATQLDKFQEF